MVSMLRKSMTTTALLSSLGGGSFMLVMIVYMRLQLADTS
jgi:hypothetical protein